MYFKKRQAAPVESTCGFEKGDTFQQRDCFDMIMKSTAFSPYDAHHIHLDYYSLGIGYDIKL
jgi:hypothetical protein